MNKFIKLKNRIKKHEGFRNKVYCDQLGNPTIGYGHLVRADDPYKEGQTYTKEVLSEQFDKDFDINKVLIGIAE